VDVATYPHGTRSDLGDAQRTGMAGTATPMRDWLHAWNEWHVEATEYSELDGERILVFSRGVGRGMTSGLGVDSYRRRSESLQGPGRQGHETCHLLAPRPRVRRPRPRAESRHLTPSRRVPPPATPRRGRRLYGCACLTPCGWTATVRPTPHVLTGPLRPASHPVGLTYLTLMSSCSL
jgi:hypothetical protein